MKYFALILFTLNVVLVLAKRTPNDSLPLLEQKVSKWMSTSGEKGFVENLGQMTDNEGNSVPFVLFNTEAPGLNLWITESGMTIQTSRMLKEPIAENEWNELDDVEIKRTGISKTKKFLDWERIDLDLKGAIIKKENIIKEGAGGTSFNFLYGHCADGIYGVKEYEKITIKDVYIGIDWVIYRKTDGEIKYDFIVHPGADYKQIELIYRSKQPIKINNQGQLEFYTDYGNLIENTPVSFYKDKIIETQFQQNYQKTIEINGDNGYETSISFELSHLATENTDILTIDPQLVWASFYGGNGLDGPMSIDTDANGNVFVTGYTSSTNFPVLNPTGGAYFQGTFGAVGDVFILKFSNVGVRLWATYYGGSGNDRGWSIATDSNGNVFVSGDTQSANLPVLNPGAGSYFQGTLAGQLSIIVLKISNSGTLLWATYFGGNALDFGYAITTDIVGNVYVTGATNSTNFPTQDLGNGAYFQSNLGATGAFNAFILKFSNNGVLLWSTYYGGNDYEMGYCITTDNSGNVYATGIAQSLNFPLLDLGLGAYFQGTNGANEDTFIIKFNSSGILLWSTYYGGNSFDKGLTVATDANGNLFVSGYTWSTNFPVLDPGNGAYFQGTFAGVTDVFISKFSNTGILTWGTYYGGSNDESVSSYDNLAIDACGNVYMSFKAGSTVLPTQASCDGGYLDITKGGSTDVFLTLFSNSGVQLWATFLGGNGLDFRGALALDAHQNLFMTGEWCGTSVNNSTYPLTNIGGGGYYDPTFNGGGDDGYIVKIAASVIIANTSIIQPTCSNICGGSATVNVSGNCSFNYLWSDGQMSQTATNLCEGVYTVTVTNELCGGADTVLVVNIIAPPPSVIPIFTAVTPICSGSTLTPLPITSNDGILGTWSPALDNTITQTYTFTPDTGQCATTTTLDIIVNPNSAPTFFAVTPICSGSTLAPLPTTSNDGISGIWSPVLDNTATQTYTFTPDAGQCATTTTLTVTVNPHVVPIFTAVAPICLGSTLTPLPITSNDGISGTWSPVLDNTITQTYTFTPDIGQCATSTTLIITVNYIPSVVVAASNSPICEGATINLTASSVIGAIYSWSGPNGYTSTDQNPIIQNANATMQGTYSVIVTVSGCSSVSSSTNVSIIPEVVVSISPLNPSIDLGETVDLIASGASSYTWTPSTGLSCVDCPNPITSPSITTTYTVIGTDLSGCSDTASVTIFVEQLCASIFVPTIFSPNEDGLNDLECVLGGCISTMVFTIYNRWGEKVFESHDLDYCWDGTYKGEKVNADVFVYTLSAIMNDGAKIEKSGNISVYK